MFSIILDGDYVWEGDSLEVAMFVVSKWQSYGLDAALCIGPAVEPIRKSEKNPHFRENSGLKFDTLL